MNEKKKTRKKILAFKRVPIFGFFLFLLLSSFAHALFTSRDSNRGTGLAYGRRTFFCSLLFMFCFLIHTGDNVGSRHLVNSGHAFLSQGVFVVGHVVTVVDS